MDKNREIAESNFMCFVKTVSALLKEGTHFDLLVGAGDSGAALVKYVEFIYEYLKLPLPTILILPTYRHRDEAETIVFNNQIFVPDAQKIISNTPIRTALFVDDEIGSGSMAYAMLNVILASNQPSSLSKYVIVAEDHGFKPTPQGDRTEIVFYPFAYKTDELWSMLLTLPSDAVINKLAGIIPESENKYKYATNILLGLPVKEFKGEKPQFTEKYNQLASIRYPDLPIWQLDFKNHLKELISKSIKD